jgi:hypothetical protein
MARRIPTLPSLAFLEAGGALSPAAAPAPVVSDDRDPPIRSAG